MKKKEVEKLDKEKKKGVFDFVELWRRVILDSVKKGISTYPVRRNYNFYSNGNATMSGKDLITYYYTIDGYPKTFDKDFRKYIRREARAGVRISYVSLFEPTRIDWASPKMRSKLRTWKNLKTDSQGEEVDAYNYRDNLSAMDTAEWREQSLMYLSDAEKRRRRNLFIYRTMIVVSGTRGEAFDKTIAEVVDYCARSEIIITRIEDRLFEYLKCFSPFSAELHSPILSEVGRTVIPDEILARFSTYDQGKIGKKGIIWGSDIYSGYSVYKTVKEDDVDAENILITGETGSGKSFWVKCLLLQLIAFDRYNGTINDIEGFEYIPFAGFIANMDNVVILNMAEGQGCYFDSVEINMTGVAKLDEDMFSFCRSFTQSYMKTLLGNIKDNNTWVETIIDNAIANTYANAGVIVDDRSTWYNSKGLTLFSVYDSCKGLYKEYFEISALDINTLETHQLYKLNDGYRDALDLVIGKLSSYFEPLEKGGIRSDVFKDRVSLEEIVNAKLVVCSFGMAGKDFSKVDKVQMGLSQLSAANISHIRSIFSKAKGKFNFKVWEEFQRWGAFPDSDKTIKTALTGGRKLGDINFVITNDVRELLDNDRFGIFQNITSFAVGALKDANTRSILCQRLSIPLLQQDLDNIVLKKQSRENMSDDTEVASIYDKAFLVNLDGGNTTLSKMDLPKHIARSDIFRTGIDLQG